MTEPWCHMATKQCLCQILVAWDKHMRKTKKEDWAEEGAFSQQEGLLTVAGNELELWPLI